MKTKSLFILLLLSAIFFTSCQEEVMEIVQPNEKETLVANSKLTNLIGNTSAKDGSDDNILDQSSCTSVELPVTVNVNGVDIIIDSEEDFEVIEAIFDQFEDDDDILNFIFPIKIILSDYSVIEVNNEDDLEELIEGCSGENIDDDDIECIDFKYPISFSTYNSEFQIIEVVTIENDEQLHNFIEEVEEGEVFASLNFPVQMVLANGEVVEVNNNEQLEEIIDTVKDACDEDDDNDYGDDDFSKEGLDNLLKSCSWVVIDMERNDNDLDHYNEYVIQFKEEQIAKLRTREGDLISGTWESEITEDGAKVYLEFEGLEDFNLDWIVYELEDDKIKFYKEGDNKIILKKNCDIQVDFTSEMINNYLQECLWRITELYVDDVHKEEAYIGSPFEFMENSGVQLRVKGEWIQGNYELISMSDGFYLQIFFDDRPDLSISWKLKYLEEGKMEFENGYNELTLEQSCQENDGDVMEIFNVLVANNWGVVAYESTPATDITTSSFQGYTIAFLENGRIEVTNPNQVVSETGSWLNYRSEGLYLDMAYGDAMPFAALTNKWKIIEKTENKIYLKVFGDSSDTEKVVVLQIIN